MLYEQGGSDAEVCRRTGYSKRLTIQMKASGNFVAFCSWDVIYEKMSLGYFRNFELAS